MSTVLRVQVHAADEGGCGHYRMIWPGAAVTAAGLHDVDVVRPSDTERSRLNLQMQDDDQGRPHVIGLEETPDCDVLVLQRPLSRLLVDAIPHLQRAGVAVVVELDDDFQAVHRLNIAWLNVQPRLTPDHNWQHLQRACSMADLVTVSTPALAAKFARHGRYRILPNYLPPLWSGVPTPRDPGTVHLGWSGAINTHPTDLKQVGTTVARVVRENPGVDVAVIGTGMGVAKQFGLPEVKASGWQALSDYPAAVGMLDIGMVPLDLIPFNHAKSWLKGLEYAAVGTPFVASPTAEYRTLAEDGIGLLAHNPKDWYRHLTRLVRDVDYRLTLGARWRAQAFACYSLIDHAHLWADAWSAARETSINTALRTAGVRVQA
jgi:glycosyltransferase involved in cell wall biosynthesis